MAVAPADSAIYAGLLSDPQAAALFTDAAELHAMLVTEAALAGAQGALGVIPAEAAVSLAETLPDIVLDAAGLAEGTASAGVNVPAFVAATRAQLPVRAAPYLHWGATSQDIIDTALVLRLKTLLEICEARLQSLIGVLAALAQAHRQTVMLARTRFQQATPTTFGLKCAGWLAPLIRHRRRLVSVRRHLLVVQFGGASGNLAALDGRGLAVGDAMAERLGLAAGVPWHTQRDGIAELAAWLAMVSGALGKLGVDLIALSRSEVAEVKPGAGGGSSTMPNKANPVLPEMLVTLARFSAAQAGSALDALVQEHERDGTTWTLEWLTVPPLAVATATALRHAVQLGQTLQVDGARMRANIEASGGLVLAEAAAFALAAHMPRPEAQALVKASCVEAQAQGRHLMAVLAERVDADIDWDALADPAAYVGESDALIDRILAEHDT